MAVQIKKGILKRVGFDTTKDIAGLTDIKVKVINSITGALVEGCETTLTELPLDPSELSFKQAEILSDVILSGNTIKVSPLNAAKFAPGDIVNVTDKDAKEIFAITKISTIDYVAGIVTLEGAAKFASTVDTEMKLLIADKTGTYTGEIQIPTVTGTYFIWISSVNAGKNYNYGMIEVIENDLNDVIEKITDVQKAVVGNSSTVWGTIQI